MAATSRSVSDTQRTDGRTCKCGEGTDTKGLHEASSQAQLPTSWLWVLIPEHNQKPLILWGTLRWRCRRELAY